MMALTFLFYSSLVLIFDPFAFFTKKAIKMRMCSLSVGRVGPGGVTVPITQCAPGLCHLLILDCISGRSHHPWSLSSARTVSFLR